MIGSDNVIRENVTIHRALVPDHATVIGDNCLLMVGSHVAHDCHLGNNVIVTNNAMLAGHVVVGDRAYISGAAGVSIAAPALERLQHPEVASQVAGERGHRPGCPRPAVEDSDRWSGRSVGADLDRIGPGDRRVERTHDVVSLVAHVR